MYQRMSILIDLTLEEEAALRREADVLGMDLPTFIRRRVLFAAPPPPPETDNDLAFLHADGITAVREAQRLLLAQGIGYVYARDDGAVVRCLPDGNEEIVATSAKAPAVISSP